MTETEAIVDFVLPSPRFNDFLLLLPIVGERGRYIECLPTKLAMLFLVRDGLKDADAGSLECFVTSAWL